MKRLRVLGIVLGFVLPRPGWARLDLVTAQGLLFRSIDEGQTWTLQGHVPYTPVVDYVGGVDTLWVLTRQGQISYSPNGGATWHLFLSTGGADAVAMRKCAHDLWVLTERGEVFRNAQPHASIPTSFARDFLPLGLRCGLWVVLSAKGAVWVSLDTARTWQLRGHIPESRMVALSALPGDTLVALDTTGAVWVSSDTGRTWMIWTTLGQIGAVDVQATPQGITLVLTTSEVARWNPSSGWVWMGSPSQSGVVAMGLDPVVSFSESALRGIGVRYTRDGILLEGVRRGTRVAIYRADGRKVPVRARWITPASVWIPRGALPPDVYVLRVGAQTLSVVLW